MKRYIGYLTTILIFSLAALMSSSPCAHAAQAVLAWNASSDSSVTGYNVYFGTQSGDYQTPINAGNSTTYTATGLSGTQTCYFAVTAYSSSAESPYSQELACDFITAQTASNGQITPSGVSAVVAGGSQTYSIVPDSGYQIATLVIDGQQVSPASTYTFSNVSSCHTVAATFAPTASTTTTTTTTTTTSSSVSYTISASYQGSGSISPSGAVSVLSGASAQFAIAANTGYQVSNVVVDGQSVGAVTSYTFSGVSANHSIQATFSAQQCSITSAASGSGTISPAGTNSFASGTDASYSMTPAAGYVLSSVVVDGNQVSGSKLHAASAAPSSVSGGSTVVTSTYTFQNVEGNHNITAVFSPSLLVADAGPDQLVKTGSTVTLDGLNSTGSGNGIASYKWVQVSGPTVSLSNASLPQCTFTAPDTSSAEPLAFNLTVTDSTGASSSASCLVNVSTSGGGPSLQAGPTQTVSAYSNVTLDGSSYSDSYGTIASYTWTQTGGPTVSILNANTPTASFVAPTPGSEGQTLVFELSVVDQYGLEARGQWTVNVVGDYQPPVANAGSSVSAAPMSTVTLNGKGSSDPAGSSDTYRWTQVSGVPITLSDPTSATPTFTAPTWTNGRGSQLVFMLTVTNPQDHLSSTAQSTVTIENTSPNLPSLRSNWSLATRK